MITLMQLLQGLDLSSSCNIDMVSLINKNASWRLDMQASEHSHLLFFTYPVKK